MRTAFYIHWVWFLTTISFVLLNEKWTPEMSTGVVISNYSSLVFLGIYCAVVKFTNDKSSDRHKLGVIVSLIFRWMMVVCETWSANIYKIYTFPDKYLILAIGMVILALSVLFDVKRKLDKLSEKQLL